MLWGIYSCVSAARRYLIPSTETAMADSTSDWDDILRSMDFPPQSQSSPMDVAPANLWCFDKQNSQTPSLVDEGSRIGSPASSPCSPSKLLAPVQEWYLDDQSNFLPALEDDTTELIASPHSQQLQFDMAQMAERLADLENRYFDAIQPA